MATIVELPLTNRAYGFPRGERRRVKPIALACIHITGNSRTAAYDDLHAAARAERSYANRAGSTGPSAHYYVARDGWAIEAIDPVRYAAWSNGDVKSPNKANPGILKVLELDDATHNANEAYWLEFENVGHTGAGFPITNAQKDAMAAIIAAHAKRTGLPISRRTVHGHWEINGIDRVGCPSPKHEAFLVDVITRANLVLNPPAPSPAPAPTPPPAQEPAVTITDRTPLELDIRVGAIISDLNGTRLADVATKAWRPSPFGVATGRAVITNIGGTDRLGLVKTADVTATRPISTPDGDALELKLAAAREAGFQEAKAKASTAATTAIGAIADE